MKVAIKLGGSVITYKDANKPKARENVIKRLIKEVSKFPPPFILTHGAGSYGHLLVDKWMKGELKDFYKIHESVKKLNEIILKYCKKFKLPFDCYSSFETAKYDGKFNLDKLWGYGRATLEKGKILITYGDIALAKGVKTKFNGFEVLSADVSTCLLAQRWKADKILWVIDQDGVYDKNPELYSDSKLIKRIKGTNYNAEFKTTKIDVTGGILEKIRQSQKVGIKAQIINGLVSGNLSRVLHENENVGTIIIP